ncbi:extracellular solute-binding protein [Alcanivorax sp.]|uniref:extracellular solute-binding protein n=1 Tax=Alcanivorax sp. TaxID=1872427 RepID=UPI00262FA22A|nr:extracellular solute-binding protein [Alcanivorax sp.]
MAIHSTVLRGLFVGLCAFTALAHAEIHKSHAIAMHGQPQYPAGFSHFDYTNPNAPKGGELRLHVIGGFDSLNPFVSKGRAAAGMAFLDNSYLYDSLTVRGEDEPFTQYGLLAESIEWPDDRSWVRFHLREEARFADGEPVQADDVAWTFQTLLEKGKPFYSYYYAAVERVEVNEPLTVTFHFKTSDNRELPLIIGQLPVLPKHHWQDRQFDKDGMLPPLGSGPYSLAEAKPGKKVVYQRRKDYWAQSLPVMKGRNNFDRITYDYYLDETAALEAFKSGRYDWRHENNSKLWATAYKGPAFKSGEIVTDEVSHGNPWGAQAFIFNLRKDLFQDETLREAIGYAFDFQWSNDNLFYGQYKQNRSYFDNSEMAATGLPSKAELELLEPYREQLPEAVFNKEYQPPKTDGSGRPRENLRKASMLLKEAGYQLRDGQLYTPDNKPVRFEFLLSSPAFERIVLPFSRNLKALGIVANVSKVDSSLWVERIQNFDFDMIVYRMGQSSSPGNEQQEYWSSEAADQPGSRNLIGIKNPVVDALVDKIVAAQTREELITRCRALDRVLQWHHYSVFNWYSDEYRLAYQSRLRHPRLGRYVGMDAALDTWWDSTAK